MGIIFFLRRNRSRWEDAVAALSYVAHFSEYAMLSFPSSGRNSSSGGWKGIFVRASGEFRCERALAASDEYHQSFVPGRDASFLDFLTDCLGALSPWPSLAVGYTCSYGDESDIAEKLFLLTPDAARLDQLQHSEKRHDDFDARPATQHQLAKAHLSRLP